MNNEHLMVNLRKPKQEPASAAPLGVPLTPRPRPKEEGFSMAPIVGFVLIIALCFGGWYVFFRDSAPDAQSEAQTVAQAEVAAEAQDVITAVGKHIVLPEGEEPTVATVTDPKKLQDQAFFANAKIGYRVLIYTQARKAFLYDPAQDRLIEVAPITTDIK